MPYEINKKNKNDNKVEPKNDNFLSIRRLL